MLRDQRLAAGQIAARFAISRPAVSRHLRVLRESGLVRHTLVGRRRFYELDAMQFAGLIDWLDQFTLAAGWQRRLDALETGGPPHPSRPPPGRHDGSTTGEHGMTDPPSGQRGAMPPPAA